VPNDNPAPTPPDVAPANSRAAVIQFMWPFVRPYWRRVVFAMLGLAVAAGAVLAIGEGLKRVIDRGFAAGSASELDNILMIMVGLALAQGIGVYVRYSNIAWVNNRVVNDIRQKVYAHLLTLSPAFFEQQRVGDVLSRLSNDTQVLEGVVTSAFSFALRNAVLLIGGLVMLAITSPKLLVYVLLGVPIIIVPVILLGKKVRKLAKQSQDRLADAMARGDETIHAVRTVQAYAREGFEQKRFSDRINDLFSNAAERERTSASLAAIVIVLAFTAVSIILWIGGHEVLAGRMTAGQLSAFVFYAVMVATAVGAISEVFGQLKRASGASERIRELLATATDIAAPAHPVALPAGKEARGDIVFDHVTFSYPTRPQSEALTDFSLAVKPGEVVALVGPSGAGKSTVFQLLLRFYDPKAGSISIDGVDVKTAELNALRERFALVSQDPVIFSGSVMENVRYGDLEAADADVRAACDAAHVTEFANALPNGLNTELGERGVRLSGGQRQRVAIARAILADRPVLLLDEATSALDAESEVLVTDAIERLARKHTTLIIAHRLSTVQSADRIVVIDEGRVIAQGTHADLMVGSKLYNRLASLQLQK
jgi:ATP-binding cassette, subfamily B, bacterial